MQEPIPIVVALHHVAACQWLFRPSLYISSADLHMEKITIHNPALLKATSLAGWSVSDRLKRHTYSFPKGSTLSARQSVTCEGSGGRDERRR